MKTEKMKVKFLTAIWGARYIEEFCLVSLPSYLSSGNLPALAEAFDVEILILTSEESQPNFDEHPNFTILKSLCPVRLILIDDLITTEAYGVTLTLAYARGIRDSGDQQTETCFFFMNSDFILSENSLRTAVDKLREGHRCILAPSLRSNTETILPHLVEAVDKETGILSIPSRDLVDLAFRNLHPTTIAKTVTQNFVGCTTHNQIYWQVDDNTLLARYHLIFMLAIKPEVPIGPVNSYCDYGFVPEMVPSGNFTILDDSDEFFMLELQPNSREKSFLANGALKPKQIAKELSSWTTREHRQYANVDVLFRTGEASEKLPEARKQLANFLQQIQSHMHARPINHIDHYYWSRGVNNWAVLKNTDKPHLTPVVPPELVVSQKKFAHTFNVSKRVGVAQFYVDFFGYLRKMAGVMPNISIWHHLWLDSRIVLKWIEEMKKRPHRRNLLVCDDRSPMANTLHNFAPFDVLLDVDKFIATARPLPCANDVGDATLYDNIFLHIYSWEDSAISNIFENAQRCLKPGGTVAIFIEGRKNGEYSIIDGIELTGSADTFFPENWLAYEVTSAYAGGILKWCLHRTERYLFRKLWLTNLRGLPQFSAGAVFWPIAVMLTALNNFRLRNGISTCPNICSSTLVSMRRRSLSETDAEPLTRNSG